MTRPWAWVTRCKRAVSVSERVSSASYRSSRCAHCPWGDDHTALAQVLIDFGHTAMLCVTQGTDRRNDIQAKLWHLGKAKRPSASGR